MKLSTTYLGPEIKFISLAKESYLKLMLTALLSIYTVKVVH